VLQPRTGGGTLSCRPLLGGIALSALLSGCGGAAGHHPSHSAAAAPVASAARAVHDAGQAVRPRPQAVVTDELQNRLLVVSLPSGAIQRTVALAPDPEDVAATGDGGLVIVVSSRAGEVTVLRRSDLQVVGTVGGFHEPHIVAVSPDRTYAFVTDDARGTVTAIRLSDMKVTSTISIGSGAHHIAISPDERRMWIALGESADRIAILDASVRHPQLHGTFVDPGHPRLIGYFSPGFPAHDLSFSSDGRQVWVSSAAGPDVTVFDAVSHGVLFRVPVGPPPQHIAITGRYAYLTSGYGGVIEKVDVATGRVAARASSPSGSFELAVADGFVATASLLRGTIAIYTADLKLLRVSKLGPATRELAISRP
jgi:DNA-binding beta-propeller fold protein YncE